MTKELSDHCGEWFKVLVPNNIVLTDYYQWCEKSFGFYGGEWYIKQEPYIETRIFFSYIIFFKKEHDALLFIMTWGGKFSEEKHKIKKDKK